ATAGAWMLAGRMPVCVRRRPVRSRRARDGSRPRRSWRDRTPVGEATRIVPADAGVLEQSPADGVPAAGAGHVVGDAVGDAGGDGGIGEVVAAGLRPVAALPLAVLPVGIAAVTAADVQRDRGARGELDVERGAVGSGQ